MIQCITIGNADMAKPLLKELSIIIHTYFPRARMLIYTNTPYWKQDGKQKIIINVRNMSPIYVHDLIKLFPITWDYSSGPVHAVEQGKNIDDESAVWSKLCHPNEMIIMPEITWTHIYTWEECSTNI